VQADEVVGVALGLLAVRFGYRPPADPLPPAPRRDPSEVIDGG
jgi:hypothetical protein